MPTNDERREVAARLRDMAPGSDWPNYVAEACGMDVLKMSNNFHTFTEQLCQRIADLIEPEERTCNMERSSDYFNAEVTTWFCSECGSPIYNDVRPSYCLYCGARLVEE